MVWTFRNIQSFFFFFVSHAKYIKSHWASQPAATMPQRVVSCYSSWSISMSRSMLDGYREGKRKSITYLFLSSSFVSFVKETNLTCGQLDSSASSALHCTLILILHNVNSASYAWHENSIIHTWRQRVRSRERKHLPFIHFSGIKFKVVSHLWVEWFVAVLSCRCPII